ncbi:MAG: cytochrome P450 [Spongiibacteraceae bacterium]
MNTVAAPEMAPIPSHVPTELIWDHPEIKTFARQLADPYDIVAPLHAGPDIIWARGAAYGEPGWILTRHDPIQDAFLDPATFTSTETYEVGPLLGVDWRQVPLELDPPDHRAYRMVLQPWFNPNAINRLETFIRDTANELIERFEARGQCEFFSEFSCLFPSYIFLHLMGMPRENLDEFLGWTHGFMRSTDMSVRIASIRKIRDYLESYIAKRRQEAPRDDLVDTILTAQVDGKPLTHNEVMGMCIMLYLGGLDTVVSSLGWYMRYLATHPNLQERLRANPGDIPAAVADFLRAHGVVMTRRKVTRDVEFHGVKMLKGDWVVLPTQLAGRDDRIYTEPERVDPDREQRHLTLGKGVHNCLGAHLAGREIKIVLEEFLARFSSIRIAKGAEIKFDIEGVWAVTQLPLSLQKAK